MFAFYRKHKIVFNFFSTLMVLLRNRIQRYPSFVFLVGALISILLYFSTINIIYVVLILLLFSGFILFLSIRSFIDFCLIVLLAYASCFYYSKFILDTGSEIGALNRPVNAEIKVVANDPSLTNKNVEWLSVTKSVFVNIDSIKLHNEKYKISYLGGGAYLKNSIKYPFKYGDTYNIQGSISSVDQSYTGGFNRYLKSLGVGYVIDPDNSNSISMVSEIRPSFYSLISKEVISIRDFLLIKCTSTIKSDNVKNFMAGLLFGCRQGLSNEAKKQFLETGTIHIIAISGSHIGVLALLLLLIFRLVPIRFRYGMIPIFLFFYILMTGYIHSAVRAFIMVSIYIILKAMLRTHSGLNVLFLTCCIMLLINPYSIFNSGFVFSFVIVFFLILGWKNSSEVVKCTIEKDMWKPHRGVSFSSKIADSFKSKFVIGIMTTIIAGAASVPLQLLYNGMFTPIMPIVNIIILPLLFPLFLVSTIKILLSSLIGSAWITLVIGNLLNNLVLFIFMTVKLGYEANLTTYLPYINEIIPFILFLALILCIIFFKNKISWIFCTIIIAISFIIFLTPFQLPNRIIAISVKNSNYPVFVFTNPRLKDAIVLNCPTGSFFSISNVLRENGIKRVSEIYLDGVKKSISGDIDKIIENYSPQVVSIPTNLRVTDTFKNLENESLDKDFLLRRYDQKEHHFLIYGRDIKIEKDGEKYTIKENGKIIGSFIRESSNENALINFEF